MVISQSEVETLTKPLLSSNEKHHSKNELASTCDPISPGLSRELQKVDDHMVVVNQHISKSGCRHWRVVPQCRAVEHYAYFSSGDLRRFPARRWGKVWSLWASRDPSQTSGIFVGPKEIGRSSLQGAQCSDATHVVSAYLAGPESADSVCPPDYWGPISECRKPMRAIFLPIAFASTPPESIAQQRIIVDRSEVSVADYTVCVQKGRCESPSVATPMIRESARSCTYGVRGKEGHPVNCVSWSGAEAYCRFVGKRLPTSEEWSRAAGVSLGEQYRWGSSWPPPAGSGNFADERAKDRFPYWGTLKNYIDGFDETAPVDVYGGDESPTGVVNLAGNVREWVADQIGAFRTVRGASFGESNPNALKIARAMKYRSDVKSAHIGFRCAKEKPVR